MTDNERYELVKYRFERCIETFNEVKVHVDNGFYRTAVNRLYYACYYGAIALLLHNKIQAQTHAGVRQMLGLHFVKTGLLTKESAKFYSQIFDKRHTGDYDDFINYEADDVLELIPYAEKLINEIDQLIKQ
jgi:uncharacterized protein (UPF0332 family)